MGIDRTRKRKLVLPKWAGEILCERRGEELWLVCEECGFPPLPDHFNWCEFEDALGDFYAMPRRTRESSRKLPHVRFASASDEAGLIEYVKEHGPVLARVVHVDPLGGPVQLVQALSVLKAEQKVFSIARELISQVNELNTFLESTVVEYSKGVSPLGRKASVRPNKREAEAIAEIPGLLEDIRLASTAAVHAAEAEGIQNDCWRSLLKLIAARRSNDSIDYLSSAHRCLCHIFNLFPPILVFNGEKAVECPTFHRTGIRPMLYFLLREVYRYKHVIRLCSRDDCGQFFIPGRDNAEYCSDRCTNMVGQRNLLKRNRTE